MEKLIQMIDIRKEYKMGDETVYANDGITLDIDKGEFVAIVGKSGSGKSTLMNIIGALDVPTSGTYLLGGKNVGKLSDNQLADIRNKMIGFVFQQYNLLPRMSIMENVELPLLYAHVSAREREKRAMEALEKVGLGEKAKQMPKQLSGGQQQRVSIARALAADPSLILADEPTGALDSKTGQEVLELFSTFHAEGKSILMVTHDVQVASRADRVLFMKDGLLVGELKPGAYKKEGIRQIQEAVNSL